MEYIFDIVLVLIVLISAFIGKRKGFVKCILNLVKSIAAFILAKIAADYASVYLFENFFAKKLTEKITQSLYISSKLPGESVWEALPSFVQNLLEKSGVNSENIFTVSNFATLDEMIASTVSAVEEILVPFIALILLVLFFVGFSLLLSIVIKLIDKVFKLPVLNSLNAFLGTFVGIIFGILIIFILCSYINDIILLLPKEAADVISKLSETSMIKEFFEGIVLK